MLLGKFKISGHSMEPFFLNNQTVLISSIPFLFSKPKNGEVVVFEHKNKKYIKRITKLSNNRYFLEGYNKKDSLDSKKIGWIEGKNIIGKIVFKI